MDPPLVDPFGKARKRLDRAISVSLAVLLSPILAFVGIEAVLGTLIYMDELSNNESLSKRLLGSLAIGIITLVLTALPCVGLIRWTMRRTAGILAKVEERGEELKAEIKERRGKLKAEIEDAEARIDFVNLLRSKPR